MTEGAPPRPALTLGRDAELTLLRTTLRDGAARWITLTGAPGVGATHLAATLFYEASVARRWIDGRGLTLSALPSLAGLDLVVLDALERDGAWARALDEALLTNPSLTLLVTARARLGGGSEHALPLAPLALPDVASPDRAAPALALFEVFARAVDLGFSLSRPDDLRAAAALVCALDGLPGALSSAASRLHAFDLATLRERVTRDPTLLAPSDPSRPSLRASFDAAVEALPVEAREALARLSRCEASFDLALAEVLCGPSALAAVQTLVDRALLLATRDARGTLRHRTFALFRPWASERLSPAARRETERTLATWALAASPDDPDVRTLLTATLDRSLRDDADDRARVDGVSAALRLAGSSRTLSASLRTALDTLLASKAKLPAGLRARALLARGRDARITGRAADQALARRHLEAAVKAAETARARAVYADATLELGMLHHQRREEAPTKRCYTRALEIYRALGDAAGEGRCLGDLGALDHDMGRFEFARERYHEALARIRAAGDAWLEGAFLGNLGVLEQELGRDDEAERCYRAALRLFEPLGERRLSAITRGNLGMALHARGDARAAAEHHRQAAESLAALGDLRSESLAWARLAAALAAQSLADEARDAVTRAERARDLAGDADVAEVIGLFVCLVRLLLPPHDDARAREALGEARRPGAGRAALVERNDDARQVVLLLEGALARRPGRLDDHAELVVIDEGRRFALPGGAWHDLSRHGAQWRILCALAEHRAAGVSEGLSAEALVARAWPGERILPEAAANRLHVALSGLRKRGLRAWLLRREDGYLLAPSLRVRTLAATTIKGE